MFTNYFARLLILSLFIVSNQSLAMNDLTDDFASFSMGKKKSKKKEITAPKRQRATEKAKKPEANSKKGKYSWDPKLAKNSPKDVLNQYRDILERLEETLRNGQINKSTYYEALYVISSLRTLNENNQRICREFSLFARSEAYERSAVDTDRMNPELHPEQTDVEFPQKASFFSACLFSALQFAIEVGVVDEFFLDGLSRGSGCMEARIGALNDWVRKKRERIEAFYSANDNQPTLRLEFPVRIAVNRYIESRLQEFETAINNSQGEALVHQIVNAFDGFIDPEEATVTYAIAKEVFLEIFLSFSPVKAIVATAPHEDAVDLGIVRRALDFGQ